MERRDDNFKSMGFSWFTGEVTKVAADGTNRVKVYPHGYYDEKFNSTDDKVADKLPWATVMMPCTTAGDGIGSMNHGLEKGTWVVGFFRDGPSAQDPIIMGSIATQSPDGKTITGRQKYKQDIPEESSVDNKVYKSKAGHLIEIDNKDGAEERNITMKFERVTPVDNTNPNSKVESEWF